MNPVLAHAVNSSAPHGHALLGAGTAAVILGAGALVVAGFYLEDGAASEARRWVTWSLALRVVTGALSVGAAAIHFSVVGVHAAVDPLEGLLFALAAWLQLATGAAVIASARQSALAAVAALNAAAVAAWLWSRTLGLPFGPEAWLPQPVGPIDGLATTFEVMATALAAVLLALRGRLRHVARLSSVVTYVGAAVLVIAVAVTVVLIGYPPDDHAEQPVASEPAGD